MINFDEFLRKELENPVNLKKNGQVVGQILPMEAAAKSLVAKASQGDLGAISFVRQMTRTIDPEQEEKARKEYQIQQDAIFNKIKAQLQSFNLYDGQDLEIKEVCEIAITLDRINKIMAEPDFQFMTTDMKTGHQTITPVLQLRDKQRDLFQQQMQKLRDDAIKRIMLLKQVKI